MAKTVLITGASTGIGRAAALKFLEQGWNVAATMRSPATQALPAADRLLCPALDVTHPDSIAGAIAATLEQFQRIDVLVNNAGYGLVGPFEACTPEQIQQQFATNVFGLMNVTRALLPHFREQRSGLIINVASVGGRIAFPFYSLYHGTKWAVEGFSESLRYELEPFNIGVKLVEPGPIKTDFYTRSMAIARRPDLSAYDAVVDKALERLNQISDRSGSPPEATADVIYKAATDGSDRLRYPGGGGAASILLLRRLLSDGLFKRLMERSVLR